MAAVSKEEYLKRYLSNSDSGVKKKRKKKVRTGKSLIIDDDVNLSDIKVEHDTEYQENLLELAEENPLIFDEAGTTVLSKDLDTIKKEEEARKAMWAPVRNVSEAKLDDSSQFPTSAGRRKRHDSPSPERLKADRKPASPDLSPPRKGRSGSPEGLGKRLKEGQSERHSSDDQSPPRRPRRHNSPPRKTRHDLPSDQSPVRRIRHGSPSDQRTFKRKRHDSPDSSPARQPSHVYRKDLSDRSPARRQDSSRGRARHDAPDLSPQRKTANTKRESSSDLSPPRQKDDSDNRRPLKTRRHGTPDMSPPHRTGGARTRHDSPDKSPARRTGGERTRHDSPDLSPARRTGGERTRHDSPDLSPPRRTGSGRVATSSDLSPPRRSYPGGKGRQNTRDQSPPRQRRLKKPGSSSASPHRERQRDSQDLSPKRKESRKNERKAGLHSAAELKRENELAKRREDEMFSRMSSSATGKGAQTIHRDKEGRKRDLKAEKARKEEEERKKLEEEEKFMEWGKGVHQTKNAKEKIDDEIYEMSKPLARYKDDKDLEQMLRERERAEDPMLAFLQKKKVTQDAVSGKKEKPKYKGPAPPPNRFNIQPGYRWDGVDRSNGFEKKRFTMLANKGATREEAYKWSTEDM